MSTGRTISASGGGGGGQVKLGTTTLGAAATTITLSGLTLSGYRYFLVHFTLKNATASNCNISPFLSGDTTATNYRRQGLTTNSSTITATQGNSAAVFGLPASQYTEGWFTITRDLQGYLRIVGVTSENGGTNLRSRNIWVLREINGDCTGVTLSSDVATSLDTGSAITVYGVP